VHLNRPGPSGPGSASPMARCWRGKASSEGPFGFIQPAIDGVPTRRYSRPTTGPCVSDAVRARGTPQKLSPRCRHPARAARGTRTTWTWTDVVRCRSIRRSESPSMICTW
jgi:hypothetical protein